MPLKNNLIIGNITLNNQVILAPLAEITDYPFREIVRKLGGELTYSEMIAAKALIRQNPKTIKMAKCHKGEKPVAVQIVGQDPKEMAEAAHICESLGATFIDINMGCPQKKIVKTGAGAALMTTPELAAKIVQEVTKAVSIPVTCKIRLGWDNNSVNATYFSKLLEDAGAKMIAVHARTKKQMFSGIAQWEKIRPIKEAVNIPIIANGDIRTPEDAKNCLEKSNADGIMIGRASLGRPWLIGIMHRFLTDNNQTKEPGLEERISIINLHMQLIKEFYKDNISVLIARKHLSWYTKGLPNSANFRNAINSVHQLTELMKLTKKFMGSLSYKKNQALPASSGQSFSGSKANPSF